MNTSKDPIPASKTPHPCAVAFANLIDSGAGLIKEIRPNFIVVLTVLSVITLQALSWVDIDSPLLISDPETGVAYVAASLTSVLTVLALVVGGLLTIMRGLLSGNPPPEMTEESAKQMIQFVAEAVAVAYQKQMEVAGEIAAQEHCEQAERAART